jgi:hypothetical protein
MTLSGFAEEIDVVESIPSTIAMTLSAFEQEIDVAESIPSTIAMTLSGFAEEIDVVESIPSTIDMTLSGFSQEIDVVEHVDTGDTVLAAIAQTFRRRFSVQLVYADIAQTFRRRLVTQVMSAAVTTELFGLTQAVDAENLTPDQVAEIIRRRIRVRPGESGIDKPWATRDPPIHPGEIDFFRRKVYARNVDAMVPPPLIANRNLTTQHSNKVPRPVVDRRPRGK